jgi:hypothetical protein
VLACTATDCWPPGPWGAPAWPGGGGCGAGLEDERDFLRMPLGAEPDAVRCWGPSPGRGAWMS